VYNIQNGVRSIYLTILSILFRNLHQFYFTISNVEDISIITTLTNDTKIIQLLTLFAGKSDIKVF